MESAFSMESSAYRSEPLLTRPSSGRTVQVRRSRPASAVDRPATTNAAIAGGPIATAGVALGETMSFTSQMQSGAGARSPRYPPAAARPITPSYPTVRRDGTGLLVPHSVLGPTEDFEAALVRLHPPSDLLPDSPEPSPSQGGQDSLASPRDSPGGRTQRRRSARDAAAAAGTSAARLPTTRELEAARLLHATAETPVQIAERRRLQVQEDVLVAHDRWQRQHAQQARSVSRATGGVTRAEDVMMLTAGGMRRVNNEMLDLMLRMRHGLAPRCEVFEL